MNIIVIIIVVIFYFFILFPTALKCFTCDFPIGKLDVLYLIITIIILHYYILNCNPTEIL